MKKTAKILSAFVAAFMLFSLGAPLKARAGVINYRLSLRNSMGVEYPVVYNPDSKNTYYLAYLPGAVKDDTIQSTSMKVYLDVPVSGMAFTVAFRDVSDGEKHSKRFSMRGGNTTEQATQEMPAELVIDVNISGIEAGSSAYAFMDVNAAGGAYMFTALLVQEVQPLPVASLSSSGDYNYNYAFGMIFDSEPLTVVDYDQMVFANTGTVALENISVSVENGLDAGTSVFEIENSEILEKKRLEPGEFYTFKFKHTIAAPGYYLSNVKVSGTSAETGERVEHTSAVSLYCESDFNIYELLYSNGEVNFPDKDEGYAGPVVTDFSATNTNYYNFNEMAFLLSPGSPFYIQHMYPSTPINTGIYGGEMGEYFIFVKEGLPPGEYKDTMVVKGKVGEAWLNLGLIPISFKVNGSRNIINCEAVKVERSGVQDAAITIKADKNTEVKYLVRSPEKTATPYADEVYGQSGAGVLSLDAGAEARLILGAKDIPAGSGDIDVYIAFKSASGSEETQCLKVTVPAFKEPKSISSVTVSRLNQTVLLKNNDIRLDLEAVVSTKGGLGTEGASYKWSIVKGAISSKTILENAAAKNAVLNVSLDETGNAIDISCEVLIKDEGVEYKKFVSGTIYVAKNEAGGREIVFTSPNKELSDNKEIATAEDGTMPAVKDGINKAAVVLQPGAGLEENKIIDILEGGMARPKSFTNAKGELVFSIDVVAISAAGDVQKSMEYGEDKDYYLMKGSIVVVLTSRGLDKVASLGLDAVHNLRVSMRSGADGGETGTIYIPVIVESRKVQDMGEESAAVLNTAKEPVPQTGDGRSPVLWAIAAILSAAAGGAALKTRRRKTY